MCRAQSVHVPVYLHKHQKSLIKFVVCNKFAHLREAWLCEKLENKHSGGAEVRAEQHLQLCKTQISTNIFWKLISTQKEFVKINQLTKQF